VAAKNGRPQEGPYRCIKAEEEKADRINHPAKESCTKIEAGHPIIRIREIEVEQGFNLGS